MPYLHFEELKKKTKINANAQAQTDDAILFVEYPLHWCNLKMQQIYYSFAIKSYKALDCLQNERQRKM